MKPKPKFVDPLKGNTYRVIDGDTVEVLLDRGWKDTKTVSCRLLGVDAPENKNTRLGGPKEKLAGDLVTEVVIRWLVKRESTHQLYHSSEEKPKYAFRTIGRLFAETLDDDLGDYLLRERLVRPYVGRRRPPWPHEELDAITARARALLDGVKEA